MKTRRWNRTTRRRRRHMYAAIVLLLASGAAIVPALDLASSIQENQSASEQKQTPIDPAGWGGNHIGKPIPKYVHGDECLFCHRNSIGITWQKNAHGVTLRQGEDEPELQALVRKQPALASVANQIEYFLGSRHRVRFLRKDGYGKFAILNTQVALGVEKTRVD